MASSTNVPVIVGVGDFKNKSLKVEDAHDPSELMIRAIQAALADTGLGTDIQHNLSAQIDSISVVPPWTWTYPDLPGLLASRLKVLPQHTYLAPHGGNGPALICDEAARRVALGDSMVAVVTGGESLATLAAMGKIGKMPPPNWPKPNPTEKPIAAGGLSVIGDTVGTRHSVGLPVQVYPFYENGFRARRGQTLKENSAESARLYAEFDRIATQNPFAWNHGRPPKSAEEIGRPSPKNRMISVPYPLLMNAFNTVNLSAACIITSVANAKALGIPESKWVYPLGGAGTHDSDDFWERPNFHSSPAMEAAINSTIESSLITKDDIDCFDFYSCFPIVPKMACHYLDLPLTGGAKPITLLGGLTSFGGAGNNYSMHALTAMTRELRSGRFNTGLILANGGVMTHQYAICLSRSPRKGGSGYPSRNPLPHHLEGLSTPQFLEYATGEAVIESYTADFDRTGAPRLGHIIGRLVETGQRFIANHANEWTLLRLADSNIECIGQRGHVQSLEEGRNVFKINRQAGL
ncbi:hypothetical protein PFICI_08221 [Pestalotiopsis fici W106-1]|uniref:Thiolase-like protein type 1 additional C-terminal domain-containing protein n=1 Tax=Pestalotiopsis fici (strain W106-1 / CGMCC3.15140) TaxID=1229662 RepID=W3X5L7_PESFW|nr:uncharacterized protein PFICI_08221 [Pestalotiopsis fici W106-1]ETS80692.1 hypothetical protein PFICI_08221 [Pestalotiopsis fici W106-1]